MFKNFVNALGMFFIVVFASALILTIIHYFNFLNSDVISILKLVIPLIATFISSFKLGNLSEKKGYLSGIKFGFIVIIIFSIITFFLNAFSYKSLLYYLILLLTSVLSSMIGINKKVND